MGLQIGLVTRGENRAVPTGVALRGRDQTEAAVQMFEVAPVREVSGPGARLKRVGESAHREVQPVLGGLEQRLHEGVVVGDARARIRRMDPEPASMAGTV